MGNVNGCTAKEDLAEVVETLKQQMQLLKAENEVISRQLETAKNDLEALPMIFENIGIIVPLAGNTTDIQDASIISSLNQDEAVSHDHPLAMTVLATQVDCVSDITAPSNTK